MIKVNKFFIPYVVMVSLIGFGYRFFTAFLWISLHEAVHVIMAKRFGLSDAKLYLVPMGTYIESRFFDEARPKEDMIISAAGPAFNLLSALCLIFVYRYIPSSFIKISIDANMVLGIINLLPAYPLDGARMLRVILGRKMIYKRASRITANCSFIVGFIFAAFFIFLLFIGKVNLSIGLMAVLIIAVSYREKKRVMYIIMGDIIKKKKRFLGDSYIENKSVSVYYKSDLISLLRLVDKNKYNIFLLLDENMKIVGEISEFDVVEGLKIYGNIGVDKYMKILEEDIEE